MTIDVEEYFQVSAFSDLVPFARWDSYRGRVVRSTEAVLDMLSEAGVCGTFFVLGWVAERYPSLVRRIAEDGHEVASHGYAHRRVGEQGPAAFREDVARTKAILEDLSGAAVRGYRAASFSLNPEMRWAYEALADAGYTYSSSVYPVRHDHYGSPDASRVPFAPCGGIPIVELPMSTVRLFGKNLPCAGGGYFRLLPYRLSAAALRRVNAIEGSPCIFYFHPWEIDPGQPRIAGSTVRARVRHRINLRHMRGKLQSLLAGFQWGRVDAIYGLNEVHQ